MASRGAGGGAGVRPRLVAGGGALRFSIFDLMHNSYDPANNPLTVVVYTGSAKLGSLSCTNPNYWCTYTPNANTTGADAITYLLTDGYASVQSTLTITITP
jgi:hypothetical protein